MASSATASCKLLPGHDDSLFSASPGDVITLHVVGTNGLVQILRAEYPLGTAIAGPPATQITFTVQAGNNALQVEYAFSDTISGAGELHENCSASSLLDRLHVSNPIERYSISA